MIARDSEGETSEGRGRAVSVIIGFLVTVGIVILFGVFCLADSFFTWGIMPEFIERWAHGILVDLVPME
ncbi:MAG: hypothetical protein OER86_08370 [Phycisphaerae bacterium]|nr:hypothetical protein [Phycisphaerae bacterium]